MGGQVPDSDGAGGSSASAEELLASGRRLVESGQWVEARATYERVERTAEPRFAASAGVFLGKLLEEHGETAEAEAAYRRVIGSGQENPASAAGFYLGRLLYAAGNMEEARQVLQDAVGERRTSAWPAAELCLGMTLREMGDPAGARDAFRRVAGSGAPRLAAQAAVNLGVALKDSGDLSGAREAFVQALEGDDPSQAGYAATNLGGLALSDGQIAQAEELLRRGVEAGVPVAAQRLADLLARHGRWAEAEPLFRQAVAAGVAGSLPALGELLVCLDREEEAEVCYRRALAEGEERAVVDLGLLLLRRCCSPEDVAAVRQLGADTPDYTVQYLPIAGNLLQMLNSDKSPGQLAASLRPLAPSADLAEAEHLLRQGVAAGYHNAAKNLAGLLSGTGRAAEAEALLRPSADAGDVDAISGLVFVLMKRDLEAGAEQAPYSPEVLALLEHWAQTGDTAAQMPLGAAYEYLQRYDEALECLRKGAAAGNVTCQAVLLSDLVGLGLTEEARGLVLDLLADPDLRALDALELLLASAPPSDAALAAVRRVRVTRDVDTFLRDFRQA